MGAACSSDHKMEGEWDFNSILDNGTEWKGSFYIYPDTEEHFEGEQSGILKDFKALKGKWSATIVFDEKWSQVQNDKRIRFLGPDDKFTLTGTYNEESAHAIIKPDADNVDKVGAKWECR